MYNIRNHRITKDGQVTKDNEEEFEIGEWYSSKKIIGRNYEEVVVELQDAGFTEIVIDEQKVKKGIFAKEKSISKITIAGVNQFERGTWFKADAIVRITYNTFI